MNLAQLFLLAVGLSMDAFSVAVCTGFGMRRSIMKDALIVGLYFGAFQAGMPLIGYFALSSFGGGGLAYWNWVAVAVLTFLGGKMVVGSIKKKTCEDRECSANPCTDRKCPADRQQTSLRPTVMFPLAFATSIDALAVGATVLLQANIVLAAAIIGAITLLTSSVGVVVGNVFGAKLGAKAELAGGIILLIIGLMHMPIF